ncbi:hypothetical protein BD770DRAFT_442456 [Pilaira anomala]|nr:hypothetical protein BD770DRAFT_442456 [Pilaira anomala]
MTKKLLIATTLLSFFFNTTQAFCVYNYFSTNISINVYVPTPSPSSSFTKTINYGEKECCHFSDRSCNPIGDINAILAFMFNFNHAGVRSEDYKYYAKCDAGGAITFRGTSVEDFQVLCYQVGSSTPVDAFGGPI